MLISWWQWVRWLRVRTKKWDTCPFSSRIIITIWWQFYKEMGHLPSIINFDTCPHVKEWDTCSSSSQFAPNGSCLQSPRVRITWIVCWDCSYNFIWKYFLALAWWLAQLKRARAITVKCVLNIRGRKTVNWPRANLPCSELGRGSSWEAFNWSREMGVFGHWTLVHVYLSVCKDLLTKANKYDFCPVFISNHSHT